MRRLSAILILVLFACAKLPARAEAPLKFGVLASGPKAQAAARWQPLASYLQAALGRRVELEAHSHAELDAATAQHTVDIVLTDPGHFVILQQNGGLSAPLVTLLRRDGGRNLSAYGGVIFARSDRSDIGAIADLRGKRIAAASIEAIDGYQMQAFEMLEAGVPLPAGDALQFASSEQDSVVEAVLAGRAEVGFVRTGLLESLARDGKLEGSRLKVIHRQRLPGFPYASSTRLVPEWPVGLMPQVDNTLGSRLTIALLALSPDSAEARAAGISGFTIPAEYSGVESVLRRLRIAPFDAAPEFTLADLWRRYAHWIVATSLLTLLLASSGFVLALQKSQLRRSEQRFREALAHAPIGMAILSPEGRFLEVNRALCRVVGFEPAELLRMNFDQITMPDDLQNDLAHLKRLESGEIGSYAVEQRFVRKDGTLVWGQLTASLLHRDHRRPLQIITQIQDVSERKRAEAEVRRLNDELEQRVRQRTELLEAANRELEQFSYSMSHDMRTPLRAIDGFALLLLDEHAARLDEEGRRLLTVVRENARRMGRQIDDILHFLQLGRRRKECVEIDIAQLAREAFDELRKAHPARRMRLDVKELPPAWGDRAMLREVLLNLLSNAIKFSPADSETVIALDGTAGKDANCYSIKDFGIGFDMQFVGKLFKVFERVHPTGQYEGTAVGLAIVRRIVERHGGRVWAEGKVGQGATFHFSLPRRPSPGNDKA